MLEIGDTVQVKVLDIDRERQRISLGLKQTQEDPWQRIVNTYNIGDELEGTVTKVVTFGAFVEILDGVEGLVHISELAPHHVENPREIVQPGDEVRVKILEIDSERRRLSLSAKRVEGQVLPVRRIEPESSGEDAEDERSGSDSAGDVETAAVEAAEPQAAEAAEEPQGAVAEPAEAVEPPAVEAPAVESPRRSSSPRRSRSRPPSRRTRPKRASRSPRARPTAPTLRPSSSRRSPVAGQLLGDGRAVRRTDGRASAPASRRRSRRSPRLGAAVLSADAVVHELYETAAVARCRARALRRRGLRRRARRPRRARAARRSRARTTARGSSSCCGRWSPARAQAFRERGEPPRAAAAGRRRRGAAAVRGRRRVAAIDATIAVVADDALRAARVAARDQAALASREARQLPQAEKARRATYVVVNDGSRRRAARASLRGRARAARRMSAAHGQARARAWRARGGHGAWCWSLPAVRRLVRDLTLPLPYTSVIRQQAREKHLDPALIAAVIYAETKFDARTSATGALGLMQIEPATAEFLARRSGGNDVHDRRPRRTRTINIAYGSYYLRYLLDRYGGNETLALAAYNGGETNVDGWLAQARAAGVPFTIAAIPFAADARVRAARQRVLSAQQEYRHTYASQLGYG